MNPKLQQLQTQKTELTEMLGQLIDCRETLYDCIERVSKTLDGIRAEIHTEIICGTVMANLIKPSDPIDGGEQ